MPAPKQAVLYDLYNQQSTLFYSLTRVSDHLNIPTSSITVVAQGNTKYLVLRERYTVLYLDDFNYGYLKKRIEKIQQSSRCDFIAHDIMLDKDYNFNSTREAERKLNISHTNISRALRGLLDKVKGYTFRYNNQIMIPDKLPTLI